MYEKRLNKRKFHEKKSSDGCCSVDYGASVVCVKKRGTKVLSFLFLLYFFSASSMFLRGSFFASVMMLYTYSVIHACE